MNEIKALKKQVRAEAKAYKSGAEGTVSRLGMKKEIRHEKKDAIRAHRAAEKELRLQVMSEAKAQKEAVNF